ncbi:ABC transporter ATP-binding protein [Aestuariispira insulae]|uniref:Putative ABC transport system ATP-binding protein n=1 Tax=Aestuariispira insulae TaxID=1461337 RepID=A0A3D9HF24_9PROT|nr:ATP-binding cassette domain-containing protein [Aestuariispira insulae]RED48078.1 putative ABC transport system ATP-binding protein [Aestuariispira insulae]
MKATDVAVDRDDRPLVHLEHVDLTLGSASGDVNILKGISFSIQAGETVSVVGPSGSGKTSMLMLIAGLESASAGQLEVCGLDLRAQSEDRLALFRRDHVGIVFQGFHLIPTMTALENVAIPMELSGRSDAFEQAADSLRSVGLGHRMDHYPGQLSGGEQQRVALARAFAIKPKLLLADEPTGNLDGATGQQIIDLMFKLSDDLGTTLLLITHDPALAERCGRIVRMADGCLEEVERDRMLAGTAD